MVNHNQPVVERWTKKQRRADVTKWVIYTTIWGGVIIFGLWAGLKLGSIRIGLYVGLGIVMICLFYATFLLTWHLRSLVRAERGRWPNEEARITRLLQPLCDKAEIRLPHVFIIPTQSANACAAGVLPRRRYVGVTLGAMRIMDDEELSAVLAHEVTHLKRRDALFDGWWIALTGVILWLSAMCVGMGIGMVTSESGRQRKKGEGSAGIFGVVLIIGGFVFGVVSIFIIQVVLHVVMRRCEYMADNGAVLLTGHAKPMMHALKKLEESDELLEHHSALAMLFSVEPTSRHSWWGVLFSTHPRTSKRIARLQRLSQELGEG